MRRQPKNFRPEPFAYHQEVELEVASLTNLGTGVGRIDGWVVFVEGALPGEQVRARVWANHKGHSEADLVAVLRASPERVEPVCPLYGECGGCQYQHLSYAAQLDWKRRHVVDVLTRLAGVPFPAPNPTVPSPRPYGYRTKLTPHGERPRPDLPLAIGFLRRGTRVIVDVPHCPLATDAVNAALPALRADAAARPHKKAFTLLLRETEEGVVTDPRATVHERVGPLRFRFQAGEFFQNNPFILPALTEFVGARAAAGGARYLVDAYCGSGLFALAAAHRFERVAGVEVNAALAALAQANAELNGVDHATFLEADAARIFAALDFPGADSAVVLDPPRAGSDAAFLAQLAAFGPRTVVYVACDPATQARDAKTLVAAGYRITEVQPFDLFPQTRHIENVLVFARSGPRSLEAAVREQFPGRQGKAIPGFGNPTS